MITKVNRSTCWIAGLQERLVLLLYASSILAACGPLFSSTGMVFAGSNIGKFPSPNMAMGGLGEISWDFVNNFLRMQMAKFMNGTIAWLQFGQQMCALVLVLIAFSGVAWAKKPGGGGGGGHHHHKTPEIDPGSMKAPLLLLGGGVLLLRDNFRRCSRSGIPKS
jgi:hypothetical protein